MLVQRRVVPSCGSVDAAVEWQKDQSVDFSVDGVDGLVNTDSTARTVVGTPDTPPEHPPEYPLLTMVLRRRQTVPG